MIDGVPTDLAAWAGAYSLPNSATSPALARTLIRQALAEAPPEVTETAELLVSELVTNAILHARTSLFLHIQPAQSGFRVTIQDGSADMPIPKQAPLTAPESGRGLFLVDALSTAWGWETVPTGKQVWFELQ